MRPRNRRFRQCPPRAVDRSLVYLRRPLGVALETHQGELRLHRAWRDSVPGWSTWPGQLSPACTWKKCSSRPRARPGSITTSAQLAGPVRPPHLVDAWTGLTGGIEISCCKRGCDDIAADMIALTLLEIRRLIISFVLTHTMQPTISGAGRGGDAAAKLQARLCHYRHRGHALD